MKMYRKIDGETADRTGYVVTMPCVFTAKDLQGDFPAFKQALLVNLMECVSDGIQQAYDDLHGLPNPYTAAE